MANPVVLVNQEPLNGYELVIQTLTGIAMGKKTSRENVAREDLIRLIKDAKKKNIVIDLSESNLECIDLSDLDLSGANLYKTNLWKANLTNTNFEKANLTLADLRYSNATGANFIDAILTEARIHRMNTKEASLPAYVFRQKTTQRYILGDWIYAKKTGNIKDYHYAREAARDLNRHLSIEGRNIERV